MMILLKPQTLCTMLYAHSFKADEIYLHFLYKQVGILVPYPGRLISAAMRLSVQSTTPFDRGAKNVDDRIL